MWGLNTLTAVDTWSAFQLQREHWNNQGVAVIVRAGSWWTPCECRSPQKDLFIPQSRAQTHTPQVQQYKLQHLREGWSSFSKEPYPSTQTLVFSTPLVIYLNSQKNTPWVNLPAETTFRLSSLSVILFSSQKINSYLYMVEFTSILNWQWYLPLTGD